MGFMKAPFPWFGGKRKVAPLVWSRFGHDVKNYVEPFAGSLAVLLGRDVDTDRLPLETVNDLDGFIANVWRAIAADPSAVASYADWPANENDLHARHAWLVNQRGTLTRLLEGDPEYYDAKIAGWWLWGIAQWIGSGFASGDGAWQQVETDEGVKLLKRDGKDGVQRKLLHLGNKGQGVHRQRLHLGNKGQGVHRQRLHLGTWIHSADVNHVSDIHAYMHAIAARLRRVRVCSGDWSRVCGPSPTFKHGMTAIFLDPPYADTAGRVADLYAEDSFDVAHDVREWAIENGDNPLMRIALCGYEGEHVMPASWEVVEWKANSGYDGQRINGTNENKHKERIWFSPACLQPEQHRQMTFMI